MFGGTSVVWTGRELEANRQLVREYCAEIRVPWAPTSLRCRPSRKGLPLLFLGSFCDFSLTDGEHLNEPAGGQAGRPSV